MLKKTERAIKDGQSIDTGNIGYTRQRTNKRQRKPKGQSRMNNLETLATLDTQDTGQINVKENRKVNQEYTIQRHWQHWVHKTQDEDKYNKNTTQEANATSNTDPIKNWGVNPGTYEG